MKYQKQLFTTLPETCARKVPYRTRREGRLAMATLIAKNDQASKGLAVYKCTWVDHFHVGHKPRTWYNRKRNRGVIKHV